jgi:hypothetical protein
MEVAHTTRPTINVFPPAESRQGGTVVLQGGTVVLRAELPVSINDFARLFVAEDCSHSFEQYHRDNGDRDVRTSCWKDVADSENTCDPTAGGMCTQLGQLSAAVIALLSYCCCSVLIVLPHYS